MSLIVLCSVENGIAIASDRKILMNCNSDDVQITRFRHKHHVQKMLACDNGCVVANLGDGFIENEPLYIWTQRFVNNCINKTTKLSDMPELLLKYFRTFSKFDNDQFIIAGYDEFRKKQIYNVTVSTKEICEFDTSENSYFYLGDIDFISRLLEKSTFIFPDGTKAEAIHYPCIIEEFCLQDAVNFCRFMVDMTSQMQQFVGAPLITGGGTDVIVLKEDGVKWIQKEVIK